MDQQKTKDGKPYGPIRFEQLVKERYIISKSINTSYSDTGKMTPTERKYILKYLSDEAKLYDEKMKEFSSRNKKK